MKVQAIYNDGMIEFKQSLQFKQRKFEVTVTIPDEALYSDEPIGSKAGGRSESNWIPPASLSEPAQAWFRQLDSIFQREHARR
jgi:hypothetical protein